MAFMPRKRVRSLRCPACRTIVLRKDPEFPFCSERCRLIDLGKWASGAYVVSGPAADPEAIGDGGVHQSGDEYGSERSDGRPGKR
jgi:endogenous inhibitor of DNA gyrase (YacG/DUF329 family)